MGAVISRALLFFKVAWQRSWPTMAAWFGLAAARQASKVPLRVAMMTAWAVFLAVVWTGLTGMGIGTALSHNPFSGIPSDILYLVCSAFPLHFAVGLVFAYITWKASLATALQAMDQVLVWIFG